MKRHPTFTPGLVLPLLPAPLPLGSIVPLPAAPALSCPPPIPLQVSSSHPQTQHLIYSASADTGSFTFWCFPPYSFYSYYMQQIYSSLHPISHIRTLPSTPQAFCRLPKFFLAHNCPLLPSLFARWNTSSETIKIHMKLKDFWNSYSKQSGLNNHHYSSAKAKRYFRIDIVWD